jgi:replicative DNA helicase
MSLEAEQAVLGGIMLKPDAYWQIVGLVTEADFTRAEHRRLFTALREMLTAEMAIDALTVGEYEKRLSADWLIGLVASTPSAANVRGYAEIVGRAAELRRIRHAGSVIAGCDSYAEAQKALADIRPSVTAKMKTAKDAAKVMWETMQARYYAEGKLSGISATVDGIDDMAGGFQPGQLIVVAGRTGMGKSVWAVQFAINSGRAFYASMEMTECELIERAVANLGNIPHRWIRNPKESEELHDGRLLEVLGRVNALGMVIDDSCSVTVDDICARARQLHMADKLDVVIVDHLGLINRPGRNDASELGLVTKSFKALAKELNIPVVLLCQLNRKVTDRAGNEPTIADLRDSGRIEEDADVVILMHRPEYYKQEPAGFVKFIVGKNRSGSVGDAWAASRLSTMRLISCDAPDYQPAQQQTRGFGR